MKYIEPVIEALKAMIAWGWTIDADLSRMDMHGERRRPTIVVIIWQHFIISMFTF